MEVNSEKPLISVALCTYNGEHYLYEQLDSIFAQTYKNIELVAVDDCSTDNTVSILNEYAVKYKNMRVIVNQANQGFQKNFEIAISNCLGEFIAPSDQDDVWLPEKIDLLLKAIEGYAMSYCNSAMMDGSGSQLGKAMSDIWVMQRINDPMSLVMENCVSGHAMLFHRKLLTRAFPIPSGFFHDWWLAAVASANGGVAYCHQELVHYRQHAANVTDVLRARKTRRNHRSDSEFKRWRDTGNRIAALAEMNGRSYVCLVRLDYLWGKRSVQWICWSLLWFAIVHRASLWGLKRRSCWQRMFLPFRFFKGMRWSLLISRSN